jgi:glycine hydroxymethyltransferase
VVTTTTHKTLRGPRGGMIMCKAEHAQALDRAVFPGLQGGPHQHTTAALAVALNEAGQPGFKDYAHAIVRNAKALAEELVARGYDLVSGGTDNHLILMDLTKQGVSGKVAAKALDKAGLELNYNSVPYDTRKPFDPSGIRLGTPSVTSRGMGPSEMKLIADWMDRVIRQPTDENAEKVFAEVREVTARFPAPGLTR